MRLFSFMTLRVQKIMREGGPVFAVLRACSYLYIGASFLRRWLYQKKIFSSYRSSCFVISVGSPVAGGTGKTPFVIWLLQNLDAEKCAVITRGYRGKKEHAKTPHFVFQDDPSQFGDEAVLMKQKEPLALVIAGKNRSRSLRMAEKAKKSICILDDGMQHWPVERDLEIVTLKQEDLDASQCYWPRCFLRESFQALKRADLLVIEGQKPNFSGLKKYTKAPVIHVQRVLGSPRFSNGSVCDAKKCGIFCAIARPENFTSCLEKKGFKVVYHHFYPDHAYFSKKALEKIWQKSKGLGAKVLLCTEKDWVKMPKILDIPVAYVPLNLRVLQGKDVLENILFLIKNKKL